MQWLILRGFAYLQRDNQNTWISAYSTPVGGELVQKWYGIFFIIIHDFIYFITLFFNILSVILFIIILFTFLIFFSNLV